MSGLLYRSLACICHQRAAATGAALALLLSACANAPFDSEGVDRELRPAEVQADAEAARGRVAIWGGTIVEARNLEDRTRIEVVSYPLDSGSQRPRVEARPGARFLVYRDGYLETAEYETGRRITVRGRVTGLEDGRVGEAQYTYPVLESTGLHLWPRQDAATEPRSGFNFGFGIILTN